MVMVVLFCTGLGIVLYLGVVRPLLRAFGASI